MRISYDDLFLEFKKIMLARGVSEDKADLSARIFADNSLDGVYTHGVNRFPTFIDYIDKGYVDPDADIEIESSFQAYEIWNGNSGIGNVNATRATDRAVELAKKFGIGLVALRETNHWMRGGTYGWQGADQGCIMICWTNTLPNMPVWGGKNNKIGNNPLVLAVPRENGEHVVMDSAMAQFSYGKMEEYSLNQEKLPVYAGYNSQGDLSDDPDKILDGGRILPIGYWKGSGLSMALDLIGALLSMGNTVSHIGNELEDEYQLTQVFIAINPEKHNAKSDMEELINYLLADLQDSELIDEDRPIRYPGQRVISTRQENLRDGIPVHKDVWEKIKKL